MGGSPSPRPSSMTPTACVVTAHRRSCSNDAARESTGRFHGHNAGGAPARRRVGAGGLVRHQRRRCSHDVVQVRMVDGQAKSRGEQLGLVEHVAVAGMRLSKCTFTLHERYGGTGSTRIGDLQWGAPVGAVVPAQYLDRRHLDTGQVTLQRRRHPPAVRSSQSPGTVSAGCISAMVGPLHRRAPPRSSVPRDAMKARSTAAKRPIPLLTGGHRGGRPAPARPARAPAGCRSHFLPRTDPSTGDEGRTTRCSRPTPG
jgi:hypothetical protein